MSIRTDIRVLIAEDDYMVSEMVRGLSDKIGYTVVGTASDGNQALEMTRTLQPDVVLMDVRMPGMCGIEATRCIGEQCPTPIVMLTAYDSPELVEEATRAGAGAYLIKPPTASEVERAVVTALTSFEDSLRIRRENERLRVRNEESDEFAYMVAHDLQNPLALIVGFAEALDRYATTLSEQERQDCLQTIRHAGSKMKRIIDQLLMLALSRHGEIPLKRLDMAEVVSEALRSLVHLIAEYEAEMIVPETWPVALGHAPWVEQVWVNYISNAIKYGNRPPRVELGAQVRSDGYVDFWVRDNGQGISDADQDRLFSPLVRFDRSVEGHGLGLCIVRRIVERLGGRVEVQSEIGSGSIFRFLLPAVMSQEGGLSHVRSTV